MHYHHIICTLILLLFLSCSTTRNLPEDETLYTGIKRIEYVNDSALAHSEEALELYKSLGKSFEKLFLEKPFLILIIQKLF